MAPLKISRSYVIIFTGSRISLNVLQEFVLEENFESKQTFSASLGLFHKAGFCFAHSLAFVSQEIQTDVFAAGKRLS